MKLGVIKEPRILGKRGEAISLKYASVLFSPYEYPARRQWARALAAERTRKAKGERKRQWVPHSEKMSAAYTAGGGRGTIERTYAREQLHGSVCHINRDERKRERGRETRKNTRTRKRKREKNGKRCTCGGIRRWKTLRWVSERERERGGNSRYNFGVPRKLKLLRAEHAELSAVFLLGTIRIAHPFLHFLCFHFPGLPQVRAPSSSSSFSRGTAPFNIVGGNASGKSRSYVAATFGVKCVHDASSYVCMCSYNIRTSLHEFENEREWSVNYQKLRDRRQFGAFLKKRLIKLFIIKVKKRNEAYKNREIIHEAVWTKISRRR